MTACNDCVQRRHICNLLQTFRGYNFVGAALARRHFVENFFGNLTGNCVISNSIQKARQCCRRNGAVLNIDVVAIQQSG